MKLSFPFNYCRMINREEGLMENKLKLIVPENFKDFGKSVNDKINDIQQTDHNYILDMELIRFANGEGKCVIGESVRDKNIFILTDLYNHSVCYNSINGIHHLGPDEHYQDIKRILSAMGGHSIKTSLVMPLLYQSRQDKRTMRESLDCAMALQELQWYGIKELFTFDAHEPKVSNAIPYNMTFSNGYATGELIVDILQNENINMSKLFIVGPDEGARAKAKFVADILGGVRYGNFDKRRDYTKVIDGKNPIHYHEFVGPNDLSGYDIIVVDDMIDSGSSIIDTAKQLKEKGANQIFLMTTFALFSKGIDKFKDGVNRQYIDKVYTTNLTYVNSEYLKEDWLKVVDCSGKVATIISNSYDGISIRELLNGKEETAEKVKRLKKQ